MDVSKEQSLAVGDMGNIHIVAIPGSGKTRTIIAKVKLMRKLGYEKIVLVTYTRLSAAEMMERLVGECGQGVLNHVTVSTFHSLMIRHIQNVMPEYQLVSPEEQSTVLHNIYLKKFSTHENYEQFESYVMGGSDTKREDYKELKEKYLEYVENKKSHTLDNIIPLGVKLMAEGKLPLLDCQYLMVDEFQDADLEQIKLLLIHGKMGVVITAVGDDDQSIYGFRKALGVKGFELLEKNLNSTLYKLTSNYRSKSEILAAAFNMISFNEFRIDKSITAARGEGAIIQHHHFSDRIQEASWVAQKIQAEPELPTMILARTNANLNYVEDELIERGIPYYKKETNKYFDVIAVKIFVSALRAISSNSYEAMQRVLDILFESSGNTVLAKVVYSQSSVHLNVLSPQQSSLINSLRNAVQLNNAKMVNECILEFSSSLAGELNTLNYQNTHRINELSARLMKMKGTLAQRLIMLTQKKKGKDVKVTLMSMHSSKGLECERVFVTNFSKRIMPSKKINEGQSFMAHLEEERRLAFVGLTRSKDELYVTSSQSSASRENYFGVSEFIDEMGDILSYEHN